MKETIDQNAVARIRCESTSNPIADWVIDVEFRPLSRGFSVWVYNDNALVKPKWTKLCSEKGKIDWRRVARFIKEEESLRVYGDYWWDVEINGLPEWSQSVILCFFVVDEECAIDYRAIGELLIGFSEEEIRWALNNYGPLPIEITNDDQESSIEDNPLIELAEAACAADVAGMSLDQLKVLAAVSPETSYEAIAKGLRDVERDLSYTRVVKLSGLLISQSDSSLRQKYWAELRESVAPRDINVRLDLIREWLKEPEKPTGGHMAGMGVFSPIPTLMWLLSPSDFPTSQPILPFPRYGSVNSQTLLKALNTNNPKDAEEFVSAALSIIKPDAYYFEGPNRFSGGLAVMSRAIKRATVKLGLEIQAAADSCGIKMSPSVQIGNLPYLD